jgi:hypothetical protein
MTGGGGENVVRSDLNWLRLRQGLETKFCLTSLQLNLSAVLATLAAERQAAEASLACANARIETLESELRNVKARAARLNEELRSNLLYYQRSRAGSE